MEIAIEYILWLQKERVRINKLPLDEIEFYENGVKVNIDKKIIDDFLHAPKHQVFSSPSSPLLPAHYIYWSDER